MDNLYYNPEAANLKTIGELDRSGGSYEYDTFVVWKHSDGRIFCAEDSGCSCPTPFGDFTRLEDLTLVDSESQLRYLLGEWRGEDNEYVSKEDINSLVEQTFPGR